MQLCKLLLTKVFVMLMMPSVVISSVLAASEPELCSAWQKIYSDTYNILSELNRQSSCINSGGNVIGCLGYPNYFRSIDALNAEGSKYEDQVKKGYEIFTSKCSAKISSPITFIRANQKSNKN